MSTAIWGEPDLQPEEFHATALLKQLLVQMIAQFGAAGACIALHNEDIDQMEVRLHLRVRNASANSQHSTPPYNGTGTRPDSGNLLANRLTTVPLADPSASAIARFKHPMQGLPMDMVEEVTPQQSELFPVGATYPLGKDLIGYIWHKNETHIMRHEDYLSFFYNDGLQVPLKTDIVPTWYLVVPMQAPALLESSVGKKTTASRMWGIVILYQTVPGAVFQQKQRSEARDFTERIALYLQNEQMRRRQRRTSEYLQQLQAISAAFPTTVNLATLVETMHQFVANVVDFSSMLITLYDRDTKKMYDVFATRHGKQVEGLAAQPYIIEPEERPVWWKVTQEEKQKLTFSPLHRESYTYDELLEGAWGDQTHTESFLLLPMRMFNRVIGSLRLTSMRSNAYKLPEEIQVLETMVQIITVSIENANLYERSHKSLRDARHREELLAAMNSALQTISVSTELNATEIMHKFVESSAQLVQAKMSIFFQPTLDQKQLIAQVAYEPVRPRRNVEEEPDTQVILDEGKHNDLFHQIRIPFKDTPLEQQVDTASFFYLDQPMAEELAQMCEESAAIFLLETGIKKMLMIPVQYHSELVGILGIHTPEQVRNFRPTEVGMLLALSAQAASAIRNAQLFEEVQEAYAEQQHLDKLKDEFLVTASHELRTPLTAITGYASLLKRQSGRINTQQILRLVTKISGAAQQLTDLVASMTEAAKIGAVDKKLDLQYSPVPMQEVIEVAVNMLSVNIEQKIVAQVSADLWVIGDPLRVRQVVSNLLDNAAKYSPPDGRIEIIAAATVLDKVNLPDEMADAECDPATPVVLCHIYDEGEGIKTEDQQRIFEKFVRAPSSLTTPVRGSGLGLYICRRYIEAMGGRLWLEQSIPGEGSVFSFYLPWIEAPAQIVESEQDEPAAE